MVTDLHVNKGFQCHVINVKNSNKFLLILFWFIWFSVSKTGTDFKYLKIYKFWVTRGNIVPTTAQCCVLQPETNFAMHERQNILDSSHLRASSNISIICLVSSQLISSLKFCVRNTHSCCYMATSKQQAILSDTNPLELFQQKRRASGREPHLTTPAFANSYDSL